MVDIKRAAARYHTLLLRRSAWEAAWKDLAEHFLPLRWRDGICDDNFRRGILNSKLMDSTGVLDMRTLAAGLHGGMTNPARRWFSIEVCSPLADNNGTVGALSGNPTPTQVATLSGTQGMQNLSGIQGTAGDSPLTPSPLSQYTAAVTEITRIALKKSNFYNVVHALYSDLATFGTALMLESITDTGLQFELARPGDYVLDADAHGRINTFFRQISMTARQIKEEFGHDIGMPDGVSGSSGSSRFAESAGASTEFAGASRFAGASGSSRFAGTAQTAGSLLWSRLSGPAVDTERFTVIHGVFPREDGRIDGTADNMPYASVYWLQGMAGDAGYPLLLRESGFVHFPAFAPRWDAAGNEVYGRGPAMDVLPDCRMLQGMVATLRKMQHKIADPPLAVDAGLLGNGVELMPGGLNYVQTGKDAAGAIVAIQQPEPAALEHTMKGVEQVREVIHAGLYNDLLKTMLDNGTAQMTAEEVAARRSEKMLLIGPVLERLEYELLTPLICRTVELLEQSGALPPVPLDAEDLRIYVAFHNVIG